MYNIYVYTYICVHLWAPLGPLWAGPLWAPLGPYGPGPYGPGPYRPPWALMARALMGRALMGSPNSPGFIELNDFYQFF